MARPVAVGSRKPRQDAAPTVAAIDGLICVFRDYIPKPIQEVLNRTDFGNDFRNTQITLVSGLWSRFSGNRQLLYSR